MSTEKTLGEIADAAAMRMPDRWEIIIRIQNDDAAVELYDPQGCCCPGATCFDNSLEQQVDEAVEYSLTHDSEYAT